MSDKKYTSIHRDDAAGRIDFQGGKAVWQWSQDANDSTSILIKSLDNPELELEKTQRTQIARDASKRAPASKTASADARAKRDDRQSDEDDTLWQLRAARNASFDPYNRS